MQNINNKGVVERLKLDQHQKAIQQARTIGQTVSLLIAKTPSSKEKLH